MSKPIVVTVTQLNNYISRKLKMDKQLHNLMIKGEISNFTNHQKTGHFYFTLKDSGSSVKAIMFNRYASSVKFLPENGLSVIVRGSVQVFERDGIYQIYVEDMQPDGIGALYLAYEQLKEKLDNEGLFDPAHKLPIPKMPMKICLITAKTGAALQDMLSILGRRFPITAVFLIPALVQGDAAPKSICESITQAQDTDADLIILGRGGGSIEDLWAFNDELVARHIFSSRIPIISAVGHETDFTIADFVADLRAPTPSAAAELAVPDKINLENNIYKMNQIMYNYTTSMLQVYKNILSSATAKLSAKSPQNMIKLHSHQLQTLKSRLNESMVQKVKNDIARLKENINVIEAMSPLNVLSRGFAITYKEDKIIRSSSEIDVGDNISIQLREGKICANVVEVQLPVAEQRGE